MTNSLVVEYTIGNVGGGSIPRLIGAKDFGLIVVVNRKSPRNGLVRGPSVMRMSAYSLPRMNTTLTRKELVRDNSIM